LCALGDGRRLARQGFGAQGDARFGKAVELALVGGKPVLQGAAVAEGGAGEFWRLNQGVQDTAVVAVQALDEVFDLPVFACECFEGFFGDGRRVGGEVQVELGESYDAERARAWREARGGASVSAATRPT